MTGKRRAGRDAAPLPTRATAPPIVISPRPTRRDERRRRKREQRKRLGFAGGGVALVIAVVLVVTLAVGSYKAVTNNGGTKRTQVTMLLQIQGSDRTAAGTVLLAHDPATHLGLELLVPGRLITDVCGYGAQNFANILALPNGATASRSALSAVLDNVMIDGSWVLSTSEFATLVNTVGGITVDVDTNVVQHTKGGGGRILIPAGPNRRLSGSQAVAYLSYATGGAAGGPAQLARLSTVVDATIQRLPTDPTRIQALLRSLGAGGTSTLGAGKLAALLAGIAADDNGGVLPTDLPANPIDAGASSPSYHADESAGGIGTLVNQRLAASVPKNASAARAATVFLLNGTGAIGLVGSACPRLAHNAFTYVGSDNTSSFSKAKSQVEVFSDADISEGRALAKALGLPSSDVHRGTLNQNIAKFVVILGGDYKR